MCRANHSGAVSIMSSSSVNSELPEMEAVDIRNNDENACKCLPAKSCHTLSPSWTKFIKQREVALDPQPPRWQNHRGPPKQSFLTQGGENYGERIEICHCQTPTSQLTSLDGSQSSNEDEHSGSHPRLCHTFHGVQKSAGLSETRFLVSRYTLLPLEPVKMHVIEGTKQDPKSSVPFAESSFAFIGEAGQNRLLHAQLGERLMTCTTHSF